MIRQGKTRIANDAGFAISVAIFEISYPSVRPFLQCPFLKRRPIHIQRAMSSAHIRMTVNARANEIVGRMSGLERKSSSVTGRGMLRQISGIEIRSPSVRMPQLHTAVTMNGHFVSPAPRSAPA